MYKPFFMGLALLVAASLAGNASETCDGCHDFGPESRPHPTRNDSNGDADVGCASCHGLSAAHIERPKEVAPDASFGPHWTSGVGQQDEQCLDCHSSDVAAHWDDALHMVNNLICVTCHKIHTEKDKTLDPDTQAEVCTSCHEALKAGIHGIEDIASDNPACTTCHNPHADQRPLGVMLSNGSAGCRSCHQPPAMKDQGSLSDKAKEKHKTMTQSDRTCLDCHTGIAHQPASVGEPQVR